MKRTLIGIVTGLVALVVVCVAGPDMLSTLTIATASTNAAASAGDVITNSTGYANGWVDFVDIDITTAYAYPTVTVSVATQGGTGSGAARTIWSEAITTDSVRYPSVLFDTAAGSDVTGAARRCPLAQDKIVVSAYANNTTNAVAVVVRVGITQEP